MLFFGSTQCLACGREVGYSPKFNKMAPLSGRGGFKRCANGAVYNLCNWLVEAGSAETHCVACRLNQVVPDLNNERNKLLWGRMELAKRRMLHTLLYLGISLPSKSENLQQGLAFEIVSTVLNPSVTTGHLNGVITVNLEEADDTYRQINRQQLGENSRTLLGHFRHESAHYLWARFMANLNWDHPWRIAFRECYGNEWQDYSMSLGMYYRYGAPPDWEQRFISPYASSHPWEDWAETWAHYLQMIDGLETAEAMGLQVQYLSLPLVTLPSKAGFLPVNLPQDPHADDAFLAMLQRWICISTVLNEMADSLGEAQLYPFVIPMDVARKMRLAHYLASVWGNKAISSVA